MGMASNRELARQLGVSETAVRRAEKAGRIRREADGSWDPARVKAAWSDNTDRAQQRQGRRQQIGGPTRAAVKPVSEAALSRKTGWRAAAACWRWCGRLPDGVTMGALGADRVWDGHESSMACAPTRLRHRYRQLVDLLLGRTGLRQ
jgi:hypothetical protein